MFNTCEPYFIKNKLLNIEGNNFRNDNANEEVGYLDVNVSDLILQTPVENALVRVSSLTTEGLNNEIGIGKYFAVNRTDSNGDVPIVTLPVIENENEIYVLSVNANGYHNAYVIDIPIYPNITTSYKIYLKRVTHESESDFEFILQPILGR